MWSYFKAFIHNYRRMSSISLMLVLAACAPFSMPERLPNFKEISDYQTSATLTASESIRWPNECWWQDYSDTQLDGLIEEALVNSPDMMIAEARLHRAEANSQIAGAALFPQLDANASATGEKMSYNYITPQSATPDGFKDYARLTLDFSWEIDFWGKNKAALAAATSEVEVRKADIAQARLLLSTAIASSYAELSRLFAARDITVKTAQVHNKTAIMFSERFANGLETKGSVRQADALLKASEGELLFIDEQIRMQRNRLSALIGAGPDRGLTIERPKVNLKRVFGIPAELAANLLGRRPDIVAARHAVEAQLHQIDQKKAEFYPNVNLVAFTGFNSLEIGRLTQGGSEIYGVGPAISLPIFNAGRLQGQLSSAQASYQEAVAIYDRTVTQALQEVADACFSQKSLSNRLRKSEDVVTAATEAFRIANNRYNGGISNYLEVLYAEEFLLTNLQTLTYLQSRAFTLDVSLIKALGGGYKTDKKN